MDAKIAAFARLEGLEAHARAIEYRLKRRINNENVVQALNEKQMKQILSLILRLMEKEIEFRNGCSVFDSYA